MFDQLEKERQQLFERLNEYTEDQLHTPEKPGAWSVVQVINHLMAAEKGTAAYIRKKTQTPDAIPGTQWTAPFKVFALSRAFSFGFRFKAPPQLEKVSNEGSIPILADQWMRQRGAFHQLLEELPEDIQRKALFRHPIIGRINMYQTMKFFLFHFRHHVKQIDRILTQNK